MSNRVLNLGIAGLSIDPMPRLEPLTKADRTDLHRAIRCQDQPITQGRRVLAHYGMQGRSWPTSTDVTIDPGYIEVLADSWIAPITPEILSPVSMRLQNVPITPGYIIGISILSLPPGCTLKRYVADAVNTVSDNGVRGRVQVDVVWDDGTTTETVTTTIDIPVGTSGALSPSGFINLANMSVREAINAPTGILYDPNEVVAWSADGVTADITVTLIGAPRIADLCIFERPFKVGIEDDDNPRPAHVYTNAETPIAFYPGTYPIEGLTGAGEDKRFGARRMLDVGAEIVDQLGPMIFSWGQYRERHGQPNLSYAPWTLTASAGTFYVVGTDFDSSETTKPAFGAGCGAYGRNIQTGDELVAMGNSGVVPVMFAVRAAISDDAQADATVRLWASAYSYVDIAINSETTGWYYATAHLECGQTPLDDPQFILYADAPTSQTVTIYEAACWYLRE